MHEPKNKNTFIIGDAFFDLPPTFAQGASQSIEVAHELYKNLENENTQFNSERVKRVKMIDMKSKLNYFAFHLSNPLTIWIRNLIIQKLVKNKQFINSYLSKIYKDKFLEINLSLKLSIGTEPPFTVQCQYVHPLQLSEPSIVAATL